MGVSISSLSQCCMLRVLHPSHALPERDVVIFGVRLASTRLSLLNSPKFTLLHSRITRVLSLKFPALHFCLHAESMNNQSGYWQITH